MSHADVNGLSLYYQDRPGDGIPLFLIHGGLGSTRIFDTTLAPALAGRRVVAVDLQGHGRTADIDRPLRPELLAEDVAALAERLGLNRFDVLGYSLGGEVALRIAVQHPARVRRLVVVSAAFRRDGYYPEVVAGFDGFGAHLADSFRQSPAYRDFAELAPRPQDWPTLLAKTGDMLRRDYDWSEEVAALDADTLLVYADADAIRLDHLTEFYRLLGGGRRDGGVDGADRPRARLAVLPDRTHYDLHDSPLLAPVVLTFLDADRPTGADR